MNLLETARSISPDLAARRREDRGRVNALSEMCGLRAEELLDRLGLRLQRRGKMLVGPCPVHGGQGQDAFNIYPDGHTVRGNWKCRSRQCHLAFKENKSGSGTLVGLAWGVLSHERCGWENPGDRRLPFGQVLDFLCEFVGTPFRQVRLDLAEVEKKKFASQMAAFGGVAPARAGWPREAVLRRLRCPPAYYLARGYSAEILARYDVGLWLPGPAAPSPLAGRVAVPVYDEARRTVVGVTARSAFERCGRCSQFHDPALACPAEKRKEHAKWLNNEGFRKEAHLYNYWFAAEHIRRTGVAVLVEGPGDVWRLEEAGVRNAVALFGNEISDPQQVILERSGAEAVVGLRHGDAAGVRFQEQLTEELRRGYRLHFPGLPRKDVGETPAAWVIEVLAPLLNGLARGG